MAVWIRIFKYTLLTATIFRISVSSDKGNFIEQTVSGLFESCNQQFAIRNKGASKKEKEREWSNKYK